jgi:hypothetical protein
VSNELGGAPETIRMRILLSGGKERSCSSDVESLHRRRGRDSVGGLALKAVCMREGERV